jgi:hypothetical protein
MTAPGFVYKKLNCKQLLMHWSETLGQKFMDQYVILPAIGTRGGIILTCSTDFYTISQIDIRSFSVTVRRLEN